MLADKNDGIPRDGMGCPISDFRQTQVIKTTTINKPDKSDRSHSIGWEIVHLSHPTVWILFL